MGFALDTQHQAFKFQPFQEKKKKEEERHKLDSLTSYDRKFPYFFFFILWYSGLCFFFIAFVITFGLELFKVLP